MSRHAAALALGVLACTATACADKTITATQVMVQLAAQPGVRSQTHDVLVQVRSGQGEQTKWEDRFDKTMTPDSDRYRWPLQFALLPKNDDATRVYEVSATALDGAGKEIARVRAISGYQAHKTLLLSLTLDDACIGKVAKCDETETCHSGKCADAHIGVDLLIPFKADNDGAFHLDKDSGIDMDSASDGDNVPHDGGTVGRDGASNETGDFDSSGYTDAAIAHGDTGANAIVIDGGEQTSDAGSGSTDSCATDNGGCGDPQFYTCTESEDSVPHCADIDECATNNGNCGNTTYYKCTNNVGASPTCTDIDECSTNNGNCGNATYYKCTNKPGEAPICADVNECATNNGGCGSKMCINKNGAPPTCMNSKCSGIASCSYSPSYTCCVSSQGDRIKSRMKSIGYAMVLASKCEV
jgi:hypothetical protein